MNEIYQPEPPPSLSDEGKDLWTSLVQTLDGLEPCDVFSLRMLVENMLVVKKQSEAIAKEGDIVDGPTYQYPNQRYKILDKANAIVDRLLNRFRCNPAARRNYGPNSVPTVDSNDPMAEFDSIE